MSAPRAACAARRARAIANRLLVNDMRPLIVASLVATLLTSCASTTPRFNAAAALAALANPGPAAVEVSDVVWTDAARHRVVPARIYSPATGSGPFPVIVFSH